MLRKALLICLTLVAPVILLASCTSALVGYLIYDYLNDSAPKLWWRGTVTDGAGEPVEGLLVQVRAEVLGDDDILSFSDTTDTAGAYDVRFRYNEEVSYTLRALDGESIVFERFIGKIDETEQLTDISLSGIFNAEISGVVTDAAGDPLQNVIILGAFANSLNDVPTVLRDDEDAPLFDQTNEAGIYELNGRMDNYAVVCAYHPDHGFAYASAHDADNDGSVGVNITMGAAGEYDVDVQVVDALGAPIADQILAMDRQFRLRLSQKWDFSAEMDTVVVDNGLFAGRNVTPSDQQPLDVTIAVQATGTDGIAQGQANVAGGTYDLELVNIGDDQPATALVNSDNPLALSEDTVVVVRVN